ncbi:MAG: hypothetical protein CL566_00740 [Alphaproteobacteria bacterium]|nr:hypothetical protein [Alphaproteobacteria bacterium]
MGVAWASGINLYAAIAGGSLAGATHFTKAGTRLAINTSPEPVSTWTASILEDIAVIAGLRAALNHPWVFIILLMIWLLPKIFRAIRAVYRKVRSWLGGSSPETAEGLGQRPARRVVPGQDRIFPELQVAQARRLRSVRQQLAHFHHCGPR